MGRDREKGCLALRVCILLTVLCICFHLYLKPRRWSPPFLVLHPGHPTIGRGDQVPLALQNPGRPLVPGGGEGGALGSKGGNTALKRQVTYVRTPKKDAEVVKEVPPGGVQPTGCCPPSPPRKKVSCGRPQGEQLPTGLYGMGQPWRVCLDEKFSLVHRIRSKHCRVYSLGLGMVDKQLELNLVQAGCDVHCFDPSIRQAHLQDSKMWLHRLSVDWRDPNPAIPAQRQHSSTKKLATILNDFGHRKIDVLKADMESAEWKILENLILEDVLEEIGQLLLEVHLHWPGFEVSGQDSAVVRYWYSLLRELQQHHFLLFYSHCDVTKPRLFLRKNLFNISSTYTLGWVNTKWKPQ